MPSLSQARTSANGWPSPIELAILAAIVLAATAMRLHDLNNQLWLDEMLTVVRYGSLSPWELVSTYDSQNHHILYTLLSRLSVWMLGDSAAAWRVPAVGFGVASVIAVYLLARYLRGAREGLLAAALLTASYHHVWFSQNARGYTALLFWTLLASWLALRALDDQSNRRWAAYAIAAALGTYTHLTMLFVVLGHFLIALRRRPNWNGVALGFGLSAMLVTLLYAPVLPQLIEVTLKHGRLPVVEEWSSASWAVAEILRSFRIILRHPIGFAGAILIFGTGLWQLVRARSVLLELLFVPALIGGAVTILSGHRIWPRFFFFLMGFAVMVVVAGTTGLGEATARFLGKPERGALAATFLCLVIVTASAASVPHAYGPKQDYLSALELLDRERRPGDAVVVSGSGEWAFRRYYGRDYPWVTSSQELARIRQGAERTWMLYALPLELQSLHPEIKATVDREFTVVGRFEGTLNGGTVFVCLSERRP